MTEQQPFTLTIGIGNQKGGVGKTSTTVQLGAGLAELGRRVLIIDLDVNAGATKHLGIVPNAFLGIFEVLVNQEDPLNIIVTPEDEGNRLPPNLHVITGSRKLEELEERLEMRKSKFDNTLLHDVLKPVLERLQGHYHYIFWIHPLVLHCRSSQLTKQQMDFCFRLFRKD
jgi:chromosome partitioning protein